MMRTLDVTPPFSFAQTLAFIARFPPCRDACLISSSQLTTAVTVDGRAHAFTLREQRGRVVIELAAGTPAAARDALVAHAEHLVGAGDDLAPLYAAAADDAPFAALVRELHGLHHVRFATLADSVVYSILMQRAPMTMAAAMKREFLAKLGVPVTVGGHTLHAMPELAAIAALDPSDVAAAIGHRAKATRIVGAARAVAELGEPFLRTAPYATARDALLAIDGIGPFSAAAILLRGLGRMDELPWLPAFDRAARALYGRRISEATIVRRYGCHIGYWSFYVMTGLARRDRELH